MSTLGSPVPTVTAVVLAHNAIDTLPRVVEAVRAQTAPIEQIVVVDNGSTDGTADWLRSQTGLDLVLLPENAGVGAGHNRGWDWARSHGRPPVWLWALEHDTVPEPGCLERLLATAAAESSLGFRIGAIVPAQALPGEPPEQFPPAPFHQIALTFNGTLLATAAVASVGPLREDFVVGQEDREYALRLDEAGYVILKDRAARVEHRNKQARRRARPSIWRSYYSNRNEAYVMVHVRRQRFARLRVLTRTVAGIARALVEEPPRRARAAARWRATLDGLRGDLGWKQYAFFEPRS